MTDKVNIQTLRMLYKSAEGSGHSVHFGGKSKLRYNCETGEPYYTDDPGTLRTSSAKMRAVWAAWEALPHLLDRLEHLEALASGIAARSDETRSGSAGGQSPAGGNAGTPSPNQPEGT